MPGHPYQWTAPDHPYLLRLAEIAARRGVPIELHLDLVPQDMATPARLRGGDTPATLRANLAGFERLLAHARGARIVWAHAGSDPLGFRTAALCRELLARHPNLAMSLRFPARLPAGVPGGEELALDGDGRPSPAWLALVGDFADRFVLGSDAFYPSPALRGPGGRGLQFATLAPRQRELTAAFVAALPREVARQVAGDNARRLYRLPP